MRFSNLSVDGKAVDIVVENGTIAEIVPTVCGKCQAIVLPDREGKVRVTVKAEGLPEAVFSRG